MKKECEETVALTVGLLIGVFVTSILTVLIYKFSGPDELVCRDGKLFEITHEGNITIYDPTYSECEEIK